MDSQEPGIEEKLVPFVEGALAEADRREVLQALPNNAALFQDVKHLREAILLLRSQAGQGLTYRATAEMAGEQVVDYVQQGDSLSRSAKRQFELQVLESPDLAEEVAILRELDLDLQQRMESSRAVPEMPAALRAAIQESYGRRAPEPAWKRPMAALVAWFAAINYKVAGAAVAGLTIVVAGASIGRYAHQSLQNTDAAVASAPVAVNQSSTTRQTTTASAPAGQVALSPDKIHPEELPRLSRLLWQKQVSHSYRDGQIFVASTDVDRAWAALNMNEGKMVASRPLKTSALPKPKEEAGPLSGIIGSLPLGAASSKSAPSKERKRDVFATTATPVTPVTPATSATGATPPAQVTAPAAPIRPVATAAPQVAIALPDAPESNPVFEADAYPSRPAPTYDGGSARNRRDNNTYQAPRPRPAPPAFNDSVRPTQMARQVPPPPPPPPAVEHHDFRKKSADETVAPAVQPLNKPAAKSGAVPRSVAAPQEAASQPEPSAAEPAPQPQPVPVSVAVEPGRPGSTSSVRNQTATDGPPGPPPADRARMDNAVATTPRQEEIQGGMRPVPKLSTAQSRVAGPSPGSSGVMARQMGGDSFEVPANAPFEVAMLPVARKLVQEAIGEARVQMERRDDGTLLLTIRPARTLTAEEVDKLRKLVREKLDLKVDDTVVIRQP